MAYQVDKFNGTFLVSVEDGTIDTSTDLRFVGKNYAGYGEVQNENFLHLLESFANTTPPPKVITGQVWYDSVSKKLKYYDGSKFKVAGGAEVSSTAPSGLSAGDFWWNTLSKQLYAWDGTQFSLIGPEISPDLGSSTVSAEVVFGTVETNIGPHTILKVFAEDKVVGIFSKSEFTLDNNENPIEDFTVIKKGFTLAKTNSITGESSDGYRLWGTARNSDYLGGFPATEYIKVGQNIFSESVRFFDPGFELGGAVTQDPADLRVRVENGDEVIIENRLGNPITFRITVTQTTDERDVAVIQPTGVVPGNDNAYTLGTALSRWNNVFSTTVTGNLIGNVTGNSTGVHKGNLLASDDTVVFNSVTKQIGYDGANIVGTLTGSVIGSATTATNSLQLNSLDPSVTVPLTAISTIPVRNTAGNIFANQFVGTADRSDKIFIDSTGAISDPAWNESTVSTKYRTARLTATPYSIVARDSSGNITANLFQGTATAARYADLAEKYLTDEEYEIGTVVAVGGEKEVTACSIGHRAIGVVSANPAFMMNKDLDGGTYIALKGRVPAKVVGPVQKGDRLTAGNSGCAMVVADCKDIFAVALETNIDSDIKIIEILVL